MDALRVTTCTFTFNLLPEVVAHNTFKLKKVRLRITVYKPDEKKSSIYFL